MSAIEVEVWRGDLVESRHECHLAVVAEDGSLLSGAGDPGRVTFARSSIKAIQALPLVEDGAADRFGLSDVELAICCASHSGEPDHLAAVRGLLEKAGVEEGALACGAHAPYHRASARALREAGVEPSSIHSNCSGKHAGMLLLASHHGWPLEGYHLASHPVQMRMLAEVARWTGTPEERITTAVDGCGVLTFALPLEDLARGMARFAAASRDQPQAGRLMRAMLEHPWNLAGTDRLCTALMRAAAGRLLAKVGAEGVYCAAEPERGIALFLKVEDGARRAAEAAVIEVLRILGLLSEAEHASLGRFAEPELLNTRGEVVGHVRARVSIGQPVG